MSVLCGDSVRSGHHPVSYHTKLTSISVLPETATTVCLLNGVFLFPLIYIYKSSVVAGKPCSLSFLPSSPCSLSSSQYRLTDLWFIHCNLLVLRIYFDAQTTPDLVSKSCLSCFFIRPLYSLNISNFSRTRCSRLILCFLHVLAQELYYFPKKSWFC